MTLETWELLSYIVTVFGLPIAIVFFILEQRKERENEEEEVYQLLTNDYTDFLKLVIDNPDLKLRSQREISDLTSEQRERMQVLFEILVSLFERAYLPQSKKAAQIIGGSAREAAAALVEKLRFEVRVI